MKIHNGIITDDCSDGTENLKGPWTREEVHHMVDTLFDRREIHGTVSTAAIVVLTDDGPEGIFSGGQHSLESMLVSTLIAIQRNAALANNQN